MARLIEDKTDQQLLDKVAELEVELAQNEQYIMYTFFLLGLLLLANIGNILLFVLNTW